MGVILDASPVIMAERRGQTPETFLAQVLALTGDQDVGLSAISYTELIHGSYRGTTNAHRTLSQNFLAALTRQLTIYPFTARAAEIAGRIDAQQRTLGQPIPFADLLIGASALSLNFAVLTANQRHFGMIPGLQVLSF